MADTFHHDDASGATNFGGVSGNPNAGRSLRRSVSMGRTGSSRGVSRISNITRSHYLEKAEQEAAQAAGMQQATASEGPIARIPGSGAQRRQAVGRGASSIAQNVGQTKRAAQGVRHIARDVTEAGVDPATHSEGEVTNESAMRGIVRRLSKAEQAVGDAGTMLEDTGASSLGDDLSTRTTNLATRLGKREIRRLGKEAVGRIKSPMSSKATASTVAKAGSTVKQTTPWIRRINLRRAYKAAAASEAAAAASTAGSAGGNAAVVGAKVSTAATSTIAQVFAAATQAVASIAMAMGPIALAAIPVMLIASVVGMAFFGGAADSVSMSSSGERVAAIAEAEYASGVADGSMHQDDSKYWDYVFGTPYVSGDATPWCASFVSWCGNQAGLIESGVMWKTGGADYWTYYRDHPDKGTVLTCDSTYVPQPGDILTYRGAGGSSEHVGIVTVVTPDGSFYTVEGNTSGSCVNRYLHTKYDNGTGNVSYSNTNWGAPATISRPKYPVISGGVGSLTGVKAQIAGYLLDQCGYDQVHVAAIMGNMYAESGYQADITEYGYSREECLDQNNGYCGFGLCGWTATVHKQALYALAAERGGTVLDVEVQLEHLKNFIAGNGYADFFAATTVEDATYRFLMDFERPADPSASLTKRTEEAKSVYTALTTTSGNPRLDGVIASAKSQLGIAYDFNWECHPGVSMDCSSLVWWAFTENGFSIPRCQNYQNGGTDSMGYWLYSSNNWTKDISKMNPGDIVMFGDDWFATDHVALYIGDGKIIHSVYAGVIIEDLASYYSWMLGAGPIV